VVERSSSPEVRKWARARHRPTMRWHHRPAARGQTHAAQEESPRSQSSIPRQSGTTSSNPPSSSGESANFWSLSGGHIRFGLGGRGRHRPSTRAMPTTRSPWLFWPGIDPAEWTHTSQTVWRGALQNFVQPIRTCGQSDDRSCAWPPHPPRSEAPMNCCYLC
jgi:hypothetical protein